MKILALDASSDACSAALILDDVLDERFEIAPQKHTVLLLPMIDSLLTANNLNLQQLDAIAVAYGPGSFTGVRLATSVAQGLAFGANLPVIPISSLQALAQGAYTETNNRNILVAQDARMQEVYWGAYKSNATGLMDIVVPDTLSLPQHVDLTFSENTWVGVGSAWKVYREILQQNTVVSAVLDYEFPHAKYVAKLAAVAWQKKLAIAPENVIPQYLRNEVAWK